MKHLISFNENDDSISIKRREFVGTNKSKLTYELTTNAYRPELIAKYKNLDDLLSEFMNKLSSEIEADITFELLSKNHSYKCDEIITKDEFDKSRSCLLKIYKNGSQREWLTNFSLIAYSEKPYDEIDEEVIMTFLEDEGLI